MAPWVCAGDDTFGQRAAGDTTMVPLRTMGPMPLGLMGPALGIWHRCVRDYSDNIVCWGRGDAGQLGFAPTETCRAPSGDDVPCSRRPRKAPFKAPPLSLLLAGDMFTCYAVSDKPLSCWGASRDGVFGTAAECPPHLSRAWPTRSGTVPAPNATCSLTPVAVRGLSQVKANPHYVSVGPRGICAQVDRDHTRCVGAIATPAANVREVQVSSGEHASACGIVGPDAVCWGVGYSPLGEPDQPTVIALDSSPNLAATVFDEPPPARGAWDPGCGVYAACGDVAPAIQRCDDDGAAGEAWSALVKKAPTLVGQAVHVRGPLVVGPLQDPVQICASGTCCEPRWRAISIGGADDALTLEDLECYGDDSRLCCNAQALGQNVIATGILAHSKFWVLEGTKLCLP